MKTFTRLFFTFVVMALLVACGGAPPPTATSAPSAAASTPLPTETTPPPTATAATEPTAMPMEASAAPFDARVAQYFLDTAGFHGIAETLTEKKVIESSYLSTTNRVKKVLSHTTWPTELDAQAQAFISSLTDFAAALEADKVDDAIKLAEPVHDAQHDLSHAIDEWAATAKPALSSTDPFDVSVAQYLLDTAGFHGIAEALTETKKIDTSALSKVNRVKKVLTQTTWPRELNEQAQAFIKSLGEFAAALEAENVEDATKLAEPVHEAQHDLSHALDEWLATAKPLTTDADPFNLHVAQYFMDTAGFHGIAEALTETRKIDTTALSKVNRVKKVLAQTVWPTALNEQAQAFTQSLTDFAAALEAENVEDSIKNADIVHDAQHELSHAIDGSDENGSDH